MRTLIAALPLLALAACGGASGPESIGNVAPPAPPTTGTPTPTPTPGSGGTGGGVGTGGGTVTPTPTPAQTQFLDVQTATTFNAIGSFQAIDVTESGVFGKDGPLYYRGNASTVRTPSGTVAYDPRDGIFTINFADAKAEISTGARRFQDPAHRSITVAWGVPDLADFNYLDSLGPTNRQASAQDPTDFGRADTVTFFYQRPGAQTSFVSLGGFVRNAYDLSADPSIFKKDTTSVFERGAFVFGQETLRSQVPITGTGTYQGGLLATMVSNYNVNARDSNYFQWITGTSSITLDFSRATMSILLTGQVGQANYAGQTLPSNVTAVPGGSTFRAEGAGTINLAATGGFTGTFNSASFSTVNGAAVPVFNKVNPVSSVAGANSIDGTFFGPNAVNVGGNFRIVGGVPDQRVDIMGAFTGAKK